MWNSSRGFTLIEVLVAIFLITVAMAGSFTLIQNIVAFSAVSSAQLTASYLSQEGIEIVRNTRDSNWLAGNPWNQGLTGCEAGCEFGTIPVKFSRTISITEPLPDKMVVSADVTWSERGRDHSVTTQTELYNWK